MDGWMAADNTPRGARETKLYAKVHALKARGVTVADIARELYPYFKLITPQQYRSRNSLGVAR